MPLSITPDEAHQNETIQMRIAGQGFVPYVKTDFVAHARSSLDTAFQASLGQTPLAGVALQADGSLLATLPPGLVPGTYDLTVTSPGQGDPSQRTGKLPAAFLVLPGELCDGGPSCLQCGGLAAKLCGDRCADVATDVANCGSCGNACAAGQVCSGGSCAASCGSPYTSCVDAGYCADTLIDPSNCGGCGVVCPPTAPLCSGGSCSASCAAPYGPCPQGAPAYCADIASDPLNCGGCGTRCPENADCVGGQCALACAPPVGTLCGDHCVDPLTDSANCGGCAGDGGNACLPGQQCVDGGCSCPVATPDPCGSLAGGETPFCTDLSHDAANCGACGKICGGGLACCGGSCVDTATDDANCGGCQIVCAANQFCQGACQNLPAACSSATPLDGDRRRAEDRTCPPPVVCADAGPTCNDDEALNGCTSASGWFTFVSDAGHDQLLVSDGGPGVGSCNTQESGFLVEGYPSLPTPRGIPTPGLVCFEGEIPGAIEPCFYSVLVTVLNCGTADAGSYVYQLPNFDGYCSGACGRLPGSDLGAYCTR